VKRAVLLVLAFVSACTEPLPSPTGVVDLRVIAASFEPPEVLITPCDPRLLVSLAAGGTSRSQLSPSHTCRLPRVVVPSANRRMRGSRSSS